MRSESASFRRPPALIHLLRSALNEDDEGLCRIEDEAVFQQALELGRAALPSDEFAALLLNLFDWDPADLLAAIAPDEASARREMRLWRCDTVEDTLEFESGRLQTFIPDQLAPLRRCIDLIRSAAQEGARADTSEVKSIVQRARRALKQSAADGPARAGLEVLLADLAAASKPSPRQALAINELFVPRLIALLDRT